MPSPGVPDLTAELKRQLQTARARVLAYSDLVKQVDCSRCGAPKQLPTKTAYVYCDHCGSLTEYDFRLANFDTNAALANQVYAYLVAPVQPALDISSATGDKERYRSPIRPVFAEYKLLEDQGVLVLNPEEAPVKVWLQMECGAPLSFPVRTTTIDCPYCHTTTHRA